MLPRTRFRWALALTLASTSLLSACIVLPYGGRHRGHHGGYYSDSGQGAVAVVPQAAVVVKVGGAGAAVR